MGRAVATAADNGAPALTAALVRAATGDITGAPEPAAAEAVAVAADPVSAVTARDGLGGASPRRVREHARRVRRQATVAQQWNSGRQSQLAAAEAALIGAVRDLLEQM